eukprot:symbB.v1.2.035144.t1/scaffold4670.1/size36719/3
MSRGVDQGAQDAHASGSYDLAYFQGAANVLAFAYGCQGCQCAQSKSLAASNVNSQSEQQNLRMGIRGIGVGLAKVPDQGLTKTFVFDNFCDFKASLRILKMVTFLNSRI